MKVKVSVSKVLRGKEAQRLIDSKRDSCGAITGQEECVALYILMDYIDGPADDSQILSAYDFAMLSPSGKLLESSIYGAAMQAVDFSNTGYPPLHAEGWRWCAIRIGSDLPTLVYWPGLIMNLDLRLPSAVYLSLDGSKAPVSPSATSTKPNATPKPTAKPTKAPTATPAPELLADSLSDFSGGQGQNSWEYLFAVRDSFNWQQMTFEGYCYKSSEPSVELCAEQGKPGGEHDIAWLYKAEASGKLLFVVTAHKVDAQGDDIDIGIYRHTDQLYEWSLNAGDTTGFIQQFELDVNGGEMFFFTMHIGSTWRGFLYDPNAFQVQVYLKQ